MAVWDHSMDGVPWTPSKMRRAVKILKHGATVTFAFHADPVERLRELDDKVFAKRPDLWLHAWSTADDRRLSTEELAGLGALRNVRKLKLSAIQQVPAPVLRTLRRLEHLALVAQAVDLSFVGELPKLVSVAASGRVTGLAALAQCPRLRRLELAGSITDLSPLGGCTRLETLTLSLMTIRSFAFVAELPRLAQLTIDTATIQARLAPLAQARALTSLHLSSNRKLKALDVLGQLTALRSVRIGQPLVARLPDLRALTKLTDLQLDRMAAWTNPEVLATLPRIRSIRLTEINPKLPAERFFFLADAKALRTLRTVDLQFIDFGKRRREQLRQHAQEHAPATRQYVW